MSTPVSLAKHTAWRAALAGTSALVRLRPGLFMDALRRVRPDDLPIRMKAAIVGVDLATVPPRAADDFADLAFLFWCSPLNRGIVRLDLDEAATLFRHARVTSDAPQVVEIGRYIGGSTALLATAVGPRGRVTSIDIDPSHDAATDMLLRRARLRDRVRLLIADANLVEEPRAADIVFIDGDHTYEGARRDLHRWGPRVRDGGRLAFHDMARARRDATSWDSLWRLRADILEHLVPRHLSLVEEAGSLSVFARHGAGWEAFD